MQSSGYAEYGRSAGSNVSIVTRSGTNSVHGSLYEFFRNSALDARNFFAPSDIKPPFRLDDFGANIGGPIARDGTFYFANYEGSRQRIGITGSGTVPSAALRSQILATSPVLQPIVSMYRREHRARRIRVWTISLRRSQPKFAKIRGAYESTTGSPLPIPSSFA